MIFVTDKVNAHTHIYSTGMPSTTSELCNDFSLECGTVKYQVIVLIT